MTRFEKFIQSEDALIDLMFELNDEMPQPLCDYCYWDKQKTPTGRMTKEAKENCCSHLLSIGAIRIIDYNNNELRNLYCRKGIKKWLKECEK